MFYDNTLILSAAQAITVTAASTNIYDVTGAGSGTAPNQTFGTATVFGADIGIGDGAAIPTAYFNVGTAFVSGGGATLTIAVQAAPDNGSNAPGTYETITATQAFVAADLIAGAQIVLPIPPTATLGTLKPRFYRFNYTVATSTFSAGTITGSILLNPATGIYSIQYPNNFTSV